MLKLGTNTTLLNQASNICSSYSFMHIKFCFQGKKMSANRFPFSVVIIKLIVSSTTKFYKIDLSPAAYKNKLYFPMHHFGHKSVNFNIDLCKLISEYFPHIDP